MNPETTDDVVRLDDLHMIFQSALRRPVWALRGLSLAVPTGSVMGLLGPNGAGKTTAISCILGLLDPTSGAAYVWGQRVSSARPRHGARCGVLLEDTRLPPFLTVRSALDAVCALRRVRDRVREVSRVVDTTGIGDLLTRTVAVLSKGQARKVGLAAALIGEPALLILDEPSAGLDAEARVEFEHLVRSLRDESRTMIIASHLLGDVEATCTHVAVVREGRVVLAGRSRELLDEARRGKTAEVHVDAATAPALERLGMNHEASRYPDLIVVRSDVEDEALFAALAGARIVPRRVEPRASILSLYLDTTRAGGSS